MDNNAIAYSIYCEYLGKKNSILNAVSSLKASNTELKDNEKLYSLIEIARIYAFAGFVPVDCSIERREVYAENVKGGMQLTFAIDSVITQKDGIDAMLKAISYLPKYLDHNDPMLAVMQELTKLYGEGKEFDDLILSINNAKHDKKILTEVVSRTKTFVNKHFNVDKVDKSDKNFINVIFSEVVEDLEEILAK